MRLSQAVQSAAKLAKVPKITGKMIKATAITWYLKAYVICSAGRKATNESPAQSKVEVIWATAITGKADVICSTGRKATDKITRTMRLGHNAGAKIRGLSWSPPGYGSAIAQQDDGTQQHEAVRADAHNHLCKAKKIR